MPSRTGGHHDHAGEDERWYGAAGAGVRDRVVTSRHQQQPHEGPGQAAEEAARLAGGAAQVARTMPPMALSALMRAAPAPGRCARSRRPRGSGSGASSATRSPGATAASSIACIAVAARCPTAAAPLGVRTRRVASCRVLEAPRTSRSAPGPSTSRDARRRTAASKRRPASHRSTTTPPGQQHDPVGWLRFGEVVGGKEDGGAAAPGARRPGMAQIAVAVLGIEPHGRLVEDQQLGAVQRGAGDVGESPPSARELAGRGGRRRARARCASMRRRDGVARLPAVESRRGARQTQVLLDGQEGRRRWVPGTRARGAAGLRAARCTTSWPKTAARPRVGREQGGEQQHRRGLAGAVRPEQAHQRPGRHVRSRPSSARVRAVVAPESVGRDRRRAALTRAAARSAACGRCTRRRVALGERRRR